MFVIRLVLSFNISTARFVVITYRSENEARKVSMAFYPLSTLDLTQILAQFFRTVPSFYLKLGSTPIPDQIFFVLPD